MQFKEWFSKTPDEMFGFEIEKKPAIPEDDNPTKALKSEVVINELVKLGPINNKQPRKTWMDHVAWGFRDGSLVADMSPLGSLKVFIRRETHDMVGNKVNICKKVIPLIKEFSRDDGGEKEIKIAHRLHEAAAALDDGGIDAPKQNYPELENLVLNMSDQLRKEHPEVMRFDGIQRLDSHYYITTFTYRGQGAESHRSGGTPQRCEAFHVNTQFIPERGLIRSWGHEVISPMKGHTWSPGVSQWDEWFTPTQSQKEIIENVVTIFLTY